MNVGTIIPGSALKIGDYVKCGLGTMTSSLKITGYFINNRNDVVLEGITDKGFKRTIYDSHCEILPTGFPLPNIVGAVVAPVVGAASAVTGTGSALGTPFSGVSKVAGSAMSSVASAAKSIAGMATRGLATPAGIVSAPVATVTAVGRIVSAVDAGNKKLSNIDRILAYDKTRKATAPLGDRISAPVSSVVSSVPVVGKIAASAAAAVAGVAGVAGTKSTNKTPNLDRILAYNSSRPTSSVSRVLTSIVGTAAGTVGLKGGETEEQLSI